jgi:hypothetical protein
MDQYAYPQQQANNTYGTAATTSSSGHIQIQTVSSGSSGNISLSTGHATTNDSGIIQIGTGNAIEGQSGPITLSVGVSQSSEGSKIKILGGNTAATKESSKGVVGVAQDVTETAQHDR